MRTNYEDYIWQFGSSISVMVIVIVVYINERSIVCSGTGSSYNPILKVIIISGVSAISIHQLGRSDAALGKIAGFF